MTKLIINFEISKFKSNHDCHIEYKFGKGKKKFEGDDRMLELEQNNLELRNLKQEITELRDSL